MTSNMTPVAKDGESTMKRQRQRERDLGVVDGHEDCVVGVVGVHQRTAVNGDNHIVWLYHTFCHGSRLIQPARTNTQTHHTDIFHSIFYTTRW